MANKKVDLVSGKNLGQCTWLLPGRCKMERSVDLHELMGNS